MLRPLRCHETDTMLSSAEILVHVSDETSISDERQEACGLLRVKDDSRVRPK